MPATEPTTSPASPRLLLNREEAADFLRVSPSLVSKLIYSRRLRPARIGRRLVFRQADLLRYVDLLTAEAA